jgi:pimeloyl-ACP methyl ester carboxylesterase
MAEWLETAGRRIAYDRIEGRGPGVLFLGGFRSDRQGSKALALEAWARRAGRAFLRFDYGGHGESGGEFESLGIGDWLADARAVLAALTAGPQVLVGSSMGGWIALLLAREAPARVAGLVTVAAAPDFTAELEAEFTEAEREDLARKGRVARASDYAPEPYLFTRRLIEQGRVHRVLDRALPLPMRTRFLQGTADTDVPVATALRLFGHATGPDIRLTLVTGADHRFSTPDCLELITAMVEEAGR